jgi:hypothetical protein
MKQNEMIGHVARIGEYPETLVKKQTEGRRPLGKYKNRWENNIEMDTKELGYELHSSGSVACCCEHCNELSVSIKCRKFLE